MKLEKFVEEFADCVSAQNASIMKGDWRTGNKFAKRYIKAFEELRSYGSEGRDALAALFYDTRPEVRVMAAAYLLRHCHNEARKILENEAKGMDVVAFGAQQTLQRWEEGAWSLDPEQS